MSRAVQLHNPIGASGHQCVGLKQSAGLGDGGHCCSAVTGLLKQSNELLAKFG
jgi:hypothetical protein